MSLRIRLSRGGAKKRPFYRVVVADSRSPRDGRFIERIGSLNPMVPKDHPERFSVDENRVKHWLSVGATPSDRLARYFADMGLVEKPEIGEQPKKAAPKAKAQEREKEKAEKAAAQAEAAKEAAAEAETAADTGEDAEAAAAEEVAPAEEAAPAAEEAAPAEEAAAPAEEEVAEAPAEASEEETKEG